MNDIENQLKEVHGNKETTQWRAPIIHKVVINKFEQDCMNDKLKQVCDLPVKLFINCKNSKRKPIVRFAKANPGGAEDLDDPYTGAVEVISREEIYFNGKENIEGFACLINVFIRQLSINYDNVAVINVDNHDEEFESKDGGAKQG